ncbi:MAG: hypothetical protein R3C14_43015 [Caldilineaceae bacterium]
MSHTPYTTNRQSALTKHAHETMRPMTGGLPVRTDLRAGLAWDDLDDKAQELFNNLTNALSGLIGGDDASS